MSEILSLGTDATPNTTSASEGISSEYSGVVPLVLVSGYQDEKLRHRTRKLPNLPSHRFRYSVWHDLSQTLLTGDQLKAPRVRDGPEEKEMMFYKMRDDTNRSIHHTRKGRERKRYTDTTENWEHSAVVNFSYQDLQHSYQRDNFIRILRRLKSVEELMLMDNHLVDLSSVSLPKCVSLNLTSNYIPSFKNIPKLQQIRHLNLQDNDIKSLHGLDALKRTPLESLELQRNPVAFTLNYRQRVFKRLPKLKLLDGLEHQPEDDVVENEPGGIWEPDEPDGFSCSVS